MPNSADDNLLFGVLAFQNGFITRDQLVAGMQAWIENKSLPLEQHLVRAGALTPEIAALLVPLVAAHVRQHEGDVHKSLADISSADDVKRGLARIGGGALTMSLAVLKSSRTPRDPESPRNSGESSSSGTRFIRIRHHASGGLGDVWVAQDTELGREVALKEIQRDKSHDADARSRFTREAEITGGLEHPGIVPVYGLGCYADGRPFYAMRFIRGKSLAEAIKAYHDEGDRGQKAEGRSQQDEDGGTDTKRKRERGKTGTNPKRNRGARTASEKNLELRRLLQRFIDVCEAIDYAHSRGVLHRDLKPLNIMLGRYGETLVVDWGLAKASGEAHAQANESSTTSFSSVQLPELPAAPASNSGSDPTQMGFVPGAPAYMSPEHAQGRLDLMSPTSDVFSLGATLYHILTGRPPYAGIDLHAVMEQARQCSFLPPRSWARDLARPLEAICLKAMSPAASARYASARHLAGDVEHWLGDEPVAALRESFPAKLGRWARRHRQWVQAGAAMVVVVAITAIAAYLYQRQTAAENLKLAGEKGKLANEKSELAEKEKAVRLEAVAKAASLRQALARVSPELLRARAYGVRRRAA